MFQNYTVGIVFLVLTIIIITIVSILIIKNGLGEKNYDERQVLMKNRCYKASYFALLIYLCIYMFFKVFAKTLLPMDDSSVIFIGLIISMGIFAISSIVNDAYFSKKDKPKNVIISAISMTIMYLTFSFMYLKRGHFIENGIFTFQSISNIVMSITYLVILITIIIKQLANKRDK